VKEREVPTGEIERAIRAKAAFVRDPSTHMFKLVR
jgi:hypothetical protein